MNGPSAEFRKFAGAFGRHSYEGVALAFSRYAVKQGGRRPDPADKPWSLTPGTALHLARFALRHAGETGDAPDEADLPALVKAFYYLRDARSAELLRSPRAEDKFELSLRGDYVRSFHDMRPDAYWARLYRMFQMLAARGTRDVELFGLGLDGLFLLPHAIRELTRAGRVELDAARLAPFLSPGGFAEFTRALSLDKREFDKRFDAGFDAEYFETTYNPLLEFPFARAGERLIPVAPRHLYARIADLRCDALQKRDGGAFVEAFNGTALEYVRKLLAQYNPRAKVLPPEESAGAALRNTLQVEERCGDLVYLQIVPNRLQGVHSATCNVFNIYERVAAVIAPSVLGLIERMERTGARRAIPAIVTFQPLHASDLGHLKACVARILRDAYEVPETKIPRYGLLDFGELELSLHSLPFFRDLADLLERKRDREHRDQTFLEFLRARLGARFREYPLLSDVEGEMQSLLRAAQKRAGGK